MGNQAKKAEDLFRQGYNCSQSVFGAFCQDVDMDFETALKLSSSFGAGMGRLRQVCGAVSAMFMVAGLKYGYANPQDTKAKTAHYKLIQSLAEQFKNKYGTIICKDLLLLKSHQNISPVPEERTEQYYKTRPCAAFVVYASEILEELIKTKK